MHTYCQKLLLGLLLGQGDKIMQLFCDCEGNFSEYKIRIRAKDK